ncbi:hypothetical protein E4U25_000319 [Claviceps purpurea]|nr:hypothetical protein E4U25_000319 [Claviceps purpurea]
MATGKRVRRKRELVATVSKRNRTQKAEMKQVQKLSMAVVAAETRGLGVGDEGGQGLGTGVVYSADIFFRLSLARGQGGLDTALPLTLA